MKLDPCALRSFAVPEVEHRYEPMACALHAISVGMGQDPLDEMQLRFADHTRDDHAALPSMALLLAYPGFWLAQPGTTADPLRLVHAEQQVRWHAPVPRRSHVRSRTRVTGVYDKGADGHALIRSERVVFDSTSGDPLATLTQLHVLRGGAGFGGVPPEPVVRQAWDPSAPSVDVKVPTRPEQALLYRLNGDVFPLHSSPAQARLAGFERPILHGMCTAGIAMQVLLRTLAGGDPGRFRSVSLRFSAPVVPGDVLNVQAWTDGRFRVRVPARDATVIDQGRVELAPGER